MTAKEFGDQMAFPTPETEYSHFHKGMTMRQHYAGLAMQGLLAADPRRKIADEVAAQAIIAADVLIAQLAKEQP